MRTATTKMKLIKPTSRNISNKIEPNYSSWQTIEMSYQCAKYCIDNDVKGAFVECGVACGNNLAAMCLAGRQGYGFDSFEGIPWAGEHDTEQPGIGRKDVSKHGILESSGVTVHGIEDVIKNFERWGLPNYSLIKGWFQNTCLKWMGEIAVLRLDGDLYDSTYTALRYLYPFLLDGGILIVDDYQLAGCKKAFDDYFTDRCMSGYPTLILDDGVTYWMK